MDKLNSYIRPDELITLPDDKEMSIAVLQDLIAEHKKLCVTRYETLRKRTSATIRFCINPTKRNTNQTTESWSTLPSTLLTP